jgi:type I restriction enzyme M protein
MSSLTPSINRELRPGTTPYVRASERRNGIVAFGDLPLSHSAGSITVPYNGSVGKAFYQPRPFFASDDVLVLVPKTPLTPAAAHFLCALIRAERFRFSYGRKWNMERMKQSVMRLPITSGGRCGRALA